MSAILTPVEVHPKLLPFLAKSLRITVSANDAVVCVDGQNDFADPKGSLYVPGAEDILEPAVQTLRKFSERKRLFTGCWHDQNHCSFKPKGQWPPHCIKGTWGAEQHPLLEAVRKTDIVVKGVNFDTESYSAVEDAIGRQSRLLSMLALERTVDRVFCCMLAYNFCVGATALDLAFYGYDTYVIVDLTKAIDGVPDKDNPSRDSIDVMTGKLLAAGVKFITSDQVHPS